MLCLHNFTINQIDYIVKISAF